MSARPLLLTTIALSAALGCKSNAQQFESPPAPSGSLAAASNSAATPATIGQPAPDFTLSSVQGPQVRLSEHRGKIVVLEWFNPDCPFVRASHTKASLKDSAARHQKDGIVWLAINSAAPRKQGHGLERNRRALQEYAMTHPILLDEAGVVGRMYGAERTPHMFVINEQGVLVYAGAIDNSPDGEGESPQGGQLVNYIDQAIAALRAKKPVPVPKTPAYGCSVKYSG